MSENLAALVRYVAGIEDKERAAMRKRNMQMKRK